MQATMRSARVAVQASKKADEMTHFVVELQESDAGKISLIPMRKIVKVPPFSVGDIVFVKFADRKGAASKEGALIRSQGTKEAMERALNRWSIGDSESRDQQGDKCKRKNPSDNVEETGKQTAESETSRGKRKKPVMSESTEAAYELTLGSKQRAVDSETSRGKRKKTSQV